MGQPYEDVPAAWFCVGRPQFYCCFIPNAKLSLTAH